MEAIKVQLTDVARTWWLAEEERLEEPITLDQFTDGFYQRFCPRTARTEMEQQFINLRQLGYTVDEYTVEFLMLSRFTSYMVADEEDRAHRLQRGLELDIHKFLITQQLNTYV